MSLVVVPLVSGVPAEDAVLRGVIDRLLGGLATRPSSADGRPPEPVIVAALEREGWEAPALSVWVEQGSILLPVAASGDAREAARVEVLRHALERAMAHDAMVVSAIDGQEQPRPGVAWVVVGVVPESAADDAAVAGALAAFERAAALTDRAADEIASRRFGVGEGAALEVPGLRYLPWVLLPRPPRATKVPSALRACPARLGVSARPVIHSGLTGGGHRIAWSGAGKERLLADLAGLHALSASVQALDDLLGPDDAAFLTFHSSTFEYPLRERILHARLGQILGAGDGAGDRLLPNANGLDDARERASAAIAAPVATLCGRIEHAVSHAEIPSDRYAFDGAYPHRPKPGFDSLRRPGPGAWQGLLDEGGWPVFDPPRQAHRLADDVRSALSDCARRDAARVIDEAMKGARATMVELRTDLEAELRGQLTRSQPADSGSSRLAHGIGATLALLHAVHEVAARQERGHEDLPDLATACDAAATRLGAGWEAEEAAILDAGRSVPSRGGVRVEVVGAAAAVLGAVLASLLLIVPPLIIGAVGGLAVWVLWRARNRDITAYFEQWGGLSERWLKQANTATAPVVAALNGQARDMKKLAARELAGALRTTQDRFRLEVRGFIHLVDGQRGIWARRRATEPRPRDVERLGRFRYAPEVGAEAMSAGQRDALDRALCGALARSLALSGIPERVTVAEYRAVLDECLVSEGDEASLVDTHRGEATAAFGHALGYGLDVEGRERSGVDGFYPDPSSRSVVLVGARVERRLQEGWEGGDLLTQVDATRRPRLYGAPPMRSEANLAIEGAIVGSLTPEIAVVLTVRGWRCEEACV